MAAPKTIEGPYCVVHDTDLRRWEIKEKVNDMLVELRPRKIYSYAEIPEKEDIKRTEAYKLVARWNRRWQKGETNANNQSETRR